MAGTLAKEAKVVIWTSEDKISDTILPRLIRMGAKVQNITIVTGHCPKGGKPRPFNPATDMESLATAVQALRDVALLIIDSVVSVVGKGTDSHKNVEVRGSLQPVVDFAESTGVGVIGITHFTKGTAGRAPLERITSFLAFGAVPRAAFAVTKTNGEDENEPTRMLVRIKNSNGPDVRRLWFRPRSRGASRPG